MPPPEDQPGTHRPVAQDDTGRLAESLSCRACGYDLKGVDAEGICPECASPVARSLGGDLLQFCDVAWLETLRRGLLLLVIGIVIGTALQIMLVLSAAVVGALTAMSGAGNALTLVMVAGSLVMAAVAVVNIIGAWLITTQDPGRSETEPKLSARSFTRVAILAGVVAGPVQSLMGQSGGAPGANAGMGVRAADIAMIGSIAILAFVALVGWFAFYMYLRQLMLRVPLPSKARQVRIVMWGYAISSIVSVGLSIASMILVATGKISMTAANPMTPTWQIIAIVVSLGSCGGLAIYLIFELWAAALCVALRKRLTVTVEAARAAGQ